MGLAVLVRSQRIALVVGEEARLSVEQFDMLNIAGISIYKIGVFLLNLVPLIALFIIE